MKSIFTTARFTVREYTEADMPEFVNLLTEPEVRLFLPQHSNEKWESIFKENLEFYKTNGGFGRWGAVDEGTGKLIGNCMLMPAREGLTGFEIGYAFEKPYWGTGAGTEITKGLVNYGFGLQKVDLICAITVMANVPSQKVLLKAGFHASGTVQLFGSELQLYRLKSNRILSC